MLVFVLLLLAAAFAQLFGAVLSWFFVKKFCANIRIVIFAEIVLMLVISLTLIAEGLSITSLSVFGVLSGLLFISVLNKVVPHTHQTKTEKIGFSVFIAMCFHEFPEGIAFGASYLISPELGMITAFMIAMHNLPEGSIVSIPYFAKKKLASGLRAVLITQILYIAGGLIIYLLAINVPFELQALGMTVAAGAMLYIIAEEFSWVKCPNE